METAYGTHGTNICIVGISKEERDKGAESLFKEKMSGNIPNLGNETDIQFQENQKVSGNPKIPTPTD